jgi:hypothetical protein
MSLLADWNWYLFGWLKWMPGGPIYPWKSAFVVAALLQPGVRPFSLTHVGRRRRGGQAVPNFLPARARMGAWKALHVEVDDEPGETLLALPDRSPADLDTEPERDWEKPLLA